MMERWTWQDDLLGLEKETFLQLAWETPAERLFVEFKHRGAFNLKCISIMRTVCNKIRILIKSLVPIVSE